MNPIVMFFQGVPLFLILKHFETWKHAEKLLLTHSPPLSKGGFKSEETGEFFRCQNKYSKSLSWAENLNFPPKTVNNLFKFSAQDSDLEYLFWRSKNSPVSSDLKPYKHRECILISEIDLEIKVVVVWF